MSGRRDRSVGRELEHYGFFIAFARVWGTQYREEAKLLQLKTNNHPLAQFRVIGTLQNMPEFHRAFGCKEGDAMVRPAAQQCALW
jgi:predicted metalloendopeptidase